MSSSQTQSWRTGITGSAPPEDMPRRTHLLCRFAERLTLDPGGVNESVIADLRSSGLSDREIHDACQIAAYFNYANRLANGLGVELPDPA